MDEKPSEPEIKVTDRRRFSSEGEALEGVEEPGTAAAAPSVEPAPEPAPRYAALPPASFEVLALSLAFQAEAQLGMYPEEGEREPRRDLDGARHTIDLLGVLQDKTKGNLSFEEQRLLDNTVTELRFRYVQAVEKTRAAGKA